MAYIISADDIKQTLPGYLPNKSESFHQMSAKLADRAYSDALKTRPEPAVILMSGGAASGKTEYIGITAVMPESFSIAFSAFLGRERKFSPEHFFRTHAASRKALLDISEKFPDLPIDIIDSTYHSDNSLSFTRLVFKDRDSMLELLRARQYTEEAIRNIIFHAT